MLKVPPSLPGLKDKAVHVAHTLIGKIARVAAATRFELEQMPAAPLFTPGLRRLSALWQNSYLYSISRLANDPMVASHPHWEDILAIIRTANPDNQYPLISIQAFDRFVSHVPHLFDEALTLHQLTQTGLEILKEPNNLEERRMKAGFKVIQTLTNTALVTAPADAWALRHILSTYKKIGITEYLTKGGILTQESFAKNKGLNVRQLTIDTDFLFSRGYLDRQGDGYVLPHNQSEFAWEEAREIPKDVMNTDIAQKLVNHLTGVEDSSAILNLWLAESLYPASDKVKGRSWVMDYRQVQLGYYLTALVLGLHAAGIGKKVKEGEPLGAIRLPKKCILIFQAAGLVDSEERWTSLAPRLFQKGPGSLGIIYAYLPLVQDHEARLTGVPTKSHVMRAKNITSSREAHGESFRDMVSKILDYIEATGHRFKYVIEHAVGHGLALQEFLKQAKARGWTDVEKQIRFMGFDYEETALDSGARTARANGLLPANTILEAADIGRPDQLLAALEKHQITEQDLEGSIFIVGAGFHEFRGSDADMVRLLKRYHKMNLIIMSDETTDMSAPMLRDIAYQSNHPSFKWMHEMSGQVLRPAYPTAGARQDWPRVFSDAGYHYRPEHSRKTRSVRPVEMPEEKNPPHRIGYFFVPSPFSRIKKL